MMILAKNVLECGSMVTACGMIISVNNALSLTYVKRKVSSSSSKEVKTINYDSDIALKQLRNRQEAWSRQTPAKERGAERSEEKKE